MEKSKTKMTPEEKSALQCMIAVMLADGKIQPGEQQFLNEICRRFDITEEELNEAFATLGTSRHVFPKDPPGRISYLLDMAYMMLADGSIDPREMDLCQRASRCLGFEPAVVDQVVSAIEKGIEREKIEKLMQSFV